MKYAIAIILHLVLTGCGNAMHDERNDVWMDADFAPYFQEFLKEGGKNRDVRNLAITFGDVPSGVDAICYHIGKSVIVSPGKFEAFSDIRKKALIFHELGHCVLGRFKHNDALLADGCPASLMAETTPKNDCLNTHWEEYVRELF